MIKIKKGLDLPIDGLPSQKIENAKPVTTVAVTGSDFIGMKPTMLVKEGEKVKLGQKLFECKKTPGVFYTSPASGVVKAINRGERRVFQTLEITVDGEDYQSFENYKEQDLSAWTSEAIEELLAESGLWTSFRQRPFSRVPSRHTKPIAIFVNCMDSNPCAPSPELVLADYESDFVKGVEVISQFHGENIFVTKKHGAKIPDVSKVSGVKVEEFAGPHPAGNVGTHIHFLAPVSANKIAWHIGYLDVVAIGRLFTTGKLFTEKVISIGGPAVSKPRLLRTRQGANLDELFENETQGAVVRKISGSVLNGRQICSTFKYLGRYHNQISALEESTEREFLGWQGPGFDKFSIKNTYAGKFKKPSFSFKTSLFGSHRAMVPVGIFEKVMPLDILPTQLLRALVTNDLDYAQQLGALELDEEDLALCTFASPGKTDFGPYLREILTTIEKEG